MSGCQLVERVEGVVHLDAANAREAGFAGKLTQLWLVQPERAEAFAVTGERQGQAEQDAAALQQRANRSIVLLWLVGAIDLQAEISAIRLKCVVDGAQHSARIHRIVHNVESR